MNSTTEPVPDMYEIVTTVVEIFVVKILVVTRPIIVVASALVVSVAMRRTAISRLGVDAIAVGLRLV